MIRIVFYLLAIAAVSAGLAWLADNPGTVTVVWLGWRLETSVMVLVAVLLVIAALLMMLWLGLRALVLMPRRLRHNRDARRRRRGHAAITHGLVAVGAGDLGAARKLAQRAQRFAPHEPLTLLLQSQAAQLGHDPAAADAAFRTMAERAETRGLGLHGLFVEAMRRGEGAAAQGFAEQAVQTGIVTDWSYQAVLAHRAGMGDWAAALALVERALALKAIDKTQRARHRAVLLTAQALAGGMDRDSETAAIMEAVQLAPTLVPAAVLAGRRHAEGGQKRKALRVLEAAWRATPHPDVAAAYAEAEPGSSARDRLARIEGLVARTPGGVEGALALARAAFAAQDFAKARGALEPFAGEPTRAVATLMAQIDYAETGNEGAARLWLARALRARPDAAWVADGHVSAEWRAFSPATGRIDAFRWQDPPPPALGTEIEFQAPTLPPAEAVPALPAASATPAAALPPVIAAAPIPDDPGPDGDDILTRHP